MPGSPSDAARGWHIGKQPATAFGRVTFGAPDLVIYHFTRQAFYAILKMGGTEEGSRGWWIMAAMDEEQAQKWRRRFRHFNHFMVLLWRLGLGPWLNAWPAVGGQIMVITHTGRKTGRRLRTPVNFTFVEGELYCAAGFGAVSDWYLNILRTRQVEVWLPDGWYAGRAEEIVENETRLPLLRQVLIASGAAAPLFGLDVRRLDDQALDEATRDYRLLHIKQLEARTGPDGPGDLAWVWPASTMLLLLRFLTRPATSRER